MINRYLNNFTLIRLIVPKWGIDDICNTGWSFDSSSLLSDSTSESSDDELSSFFIAFKFDN